jgi:hypothetical protein
MVAGMDAWVRARQRAFSIHHRHSVPSLPRAPFFLEDNDDGSLYFNIHGNAMVYGHQKFKVGAIRNYENIMAYVSDFAGTWNGPGADNYETNAMFGNRVIFATANAHYHDCTWVGPLAHDNALYGSAVVQGNQCKPSTLTLAEWQALDASHDKGSSINATFPTGAEIMGWARELLGF